MKKDEAQLEFEFDSGCKKTSLSEKTSDSKVKEDLPKVLKELEVRTASDESSDNDFLSGGSVCERRSCGHENFFQ